MRIGKKLITGLCRRGKTFYWTAVTAGPDGAVTAPAASRTLEVDDALLADAPALGAQLRLQCPELSGPVAFALPSERMLLRVMELPACEAAEMDSMIQLQMDKFSPFPDDHMAVAYEVLHADENRRRVLMAGVQKESVDFIGALCAGAGLELRRMDAEPAVWWHTIRAHAAMPAAAGGRSILGIIESNQTLLITLQDAQPLAFNLLYITDDLPPDEYAAELVHEIHNLTLALDIEQGAAPLASLRFWTAGAGVPAGAGTAPWRAALAENFQCVIEQFPLHALPPLSSGIVQRMLTPPFQPKTTPQGAQAVIDFTPTAWRATAAARQLKRKLLLATALILAAWMMGMAIFFGGYRLAQIRAQRLDARMQTLKVPADEVRMLQRKLRSFEQSMERNRLSLEALREVSRLLPPGANISSFQFKRGRSVILRGEAETVEPIYDFKQALDDSPLFDKIDMGSIQPGKRRNVTVQTFQMNAQFPEASK